MDISTDTALSRRIEASRARARLLRAMRDHLENLGFLEVQTPSLVAYGTAEPTIDPIRARLEEGETFRRDGFLIPSPEVHHKKLLAEGFDRIYEFARCYRNAESFASPHHNPEFTMLEWYRRGGTMEEAIADSVALLELAFDVLERKRPTVDRITMAEAFRRHASFDLEAPDSFDRLIPEALRRGYGAPTSLDDAFYLVFLNEVEPRLLEGGGAVVLTHYPAFQAAFARPAADPRFAERFEMYAGGVELANGYGELCDGSLQRERMAAGAKERVERGKERQELDEEFLEAVGRIPGACGCALGFDRLLMVASGWKSLDEVILFPVRKIFSRP